MTVEKIIETASELNYACDRMWNTFGIASSLPDHFVKDINKRQQELFKAIEGYKAASSNTVAPVDDIVESEEKAEKKKVCDCGIYFKAAHGRCYECPETDETFLKTPLK